MPGMYEIRWLPDGPTHRFAGSRGNYYEFSTTDRLDLYSVPIWCVLCDAVTHGEHIPSLAEIDAEIRDWHDPKSELGRMFQNSMLNELGMGAGFVPQRLAKLERRRRWRESRIAPAKCIHCGSSDIVIVPLGQPVTCPRGGSFIVDAIGMCSTDFNEWFFTPEGDRIPRDTKPTYWHHPVLDQPKYRRKLWRWIRLRTKRDGGSAER